MIGLNFGKLKVLSELEGRNKNGHILYLCECECGNKKIILGASLRQGLTKSCGCDHIKKIKKHGMDGTPVYRTWVSMRNRCNNPNNSAYPKYGGRGIKVCEKWNNSFDSFYRDMGNRPKGMSIDRIDVNGNYEPNNCRWATCKEQQDNRRNSVFVVIEGVKYTPSEYAELVKLTTSGANKKIRREFKRFGNLFIKESDPYYAALVKSIEENYRA